VRLAAQGLRNMDGGDEKVSDSPELAALRRQARMVHLQSAVTAIALTVITFFLPIG
jgi:hypothetical protein